MKRAWISLGLLAGLAAQAAWGGTNLWWTVDDTATIDGKPIRDYLDAYQATVSGWDDNTDWFAARVQTTGEGGADPVFLGVWVDDGQGGYDLLDGEAGVELAGGGGWWGTGSWTESLVDSGGLELTASTLFTVQIGYDRYDEALGDVFWTTLADLSSPQQYAELSQCLSFGETGTPSASQWKATTFTSTTPAEVPEPATGVLALLGAAVLSLWRKRGKIIPMKAFSTRRFPPLLVVAVLAAMAGVARAGDASDSVLCFRTVGPDRYADGSAVLDGESYALVWTADGVFEGFDASGAAVDPADRVLMVAPLARGGRCPATAFELPEALVRELAGGQYGVWLLDTRVAGPGGAVAPRPPVALKPVLVNGYGAAAEGLSAGDSFAVPASKGADKASSGDASVVASAAAAAPQGVVQPRVKAIRVEDDRVVLTVENLPGYLRVAGGDTPCDFGATVGPATETPGGGDLEIDAPATGGAAGFFRVLRNEPAE